MKTTYRFPLRYDVQRLAADLVAAEAAASFVPNIAGYHDGGWKAIPLISRDGSMDQRPFISRTLETPRYAKTRVLQFCPYFNEILDDFQCPKNQVRLLRLEPGAVIHSHRDPEEAWAYAQSVRLHIPIVTHQDVYFYVRGRRVIMQPGELWYCDFGYRHRVANRSPVARVHLVMDLEPNAWLRAMMPRETWRDWVKVWSYQKQYVLEQRLLRWGIAAGLGTLKRRLVG